MLVMSPVEKRWQNLSNRSGLPFGHVSLHAACAPVSGILSTPMYQTSPRTAGFCIGQRPYSESQPTENVAR